jgi:hypothetical protein
MSKSTRTPEAGDPKGPEAGPDGRIAWARPSLHRLDTRSAGAMQKKSDDGVMGKGS